MATSSTYPSATPVPCPRLELGQRAIPLYQQIKRENARQYVIVTWAVVDERDYQTLARFRWFAHYNKSAKSYYAKRTEWEGKLVNIFMHREIMGLPRAAGRGSLVQVDHINGITTMNTKANLRIASPSQNMANRVRRKNTKSRFKGVHAIYGKYQPTISWEKHRVYFPLQIHEVHAAICYNHAAKLLHKEFAVLNRIPQEDTPDEETQRYLEEMVEKKLRDRGLLCSPEAQEASKVTTPQYEMIERRNDDDNLSLAHIAVKIPGNERAIRPGAGGRP